MKDGPNLGNSLRSPYVADDGSVAGPRSRRDWTARATAGCWKFGLLLRVILTTLLVNGRYFGRVTASAGQEPARAGHEPVRRQDRPGEGDGSGPADDSFWRTLRTRGRARTSTRMAGPAARNCVGGAAVLIAGPRVLLQAGRKAGAVANGGSLRWPANPRRMRLCARFAELPAGVTGRRPWVPGLAVWGGGRPAPRASLTFRFGNLLTGMRVCVLEELFSDLAWPESLGSRCCPIVNNVEGATPCRDPDGSEKSGQSWKVTGPPQLNRVGRDGAWP